MKHVLKKLTDIGYALPIIGGLGTAIMGIRIAEPLSYFLAMWAGFAAFWCGLAWAWDRRHDKLTKQFQDYVKQHKGEE